MNLEAELKLACASADFEKLMGLDLWEKAESDSEVSLKATYYDTPDSLLRAQKIGFRVRREGDRWVQTVKSKGKVVGGLHSRNEWNWELEDNRPDFTKLYTTPLADLFMNKKIRESLSARFETDILRRVLVWEENGCRIEIALDRGEIKNSTHVDKVSEVELELLDGVPGGLYNLAFRLLSQVPLQLEWRSKAQRGYQLGQTQAPEPVRADPLGLKADMTVAQAFEAIVDNCLAQFQANIDPVRYGDDIEGVHQMRVALRRFRSALKTFRKLLPTDAVADLKNDIRWLSQTLGPARDWDVFEAEGMAPLKSEFSDFAPVKKMEKRVAEKRQNCYLELRKQLADKRFTAFVMSFGRWLIDAQYLAPQHRDQWRAPLLDFAAKVLQKRYRIVAKYNARIHQLTEEEIHDLRIQIKNLRYTFQFFAEIYPKEATKPYLKRLGNIQDILGEYNDAAVMGQLLDNIDVPFKDPARLLLEGWYAARAKDRFQQFLPNWKKLMKQGNHIWH